MILRRNFRGQIRLVIIAGLVFAGLMVYAKTSQKNVEGPFALAKELPRGALVFAQFRDLPGFTRKWNESSLKEKYLQSMNYQQLSRRHLALKLAERWNEFNDGLGFQLDSAALSSAASDSGAALAIYDIGRLDLIFIARLSEAQAAASLFLQHQEGFEEKESPEGVTFYSREVEVDRGRQKQRLAFAVLPERFVLATNESLLLRTIANLKGRTHHDELAREPSFSSLAEVTVPHDVTVWVDQTKLNDDWYFKHYWVMKNIKELKTLRAGMFDLEISGPEGRWIERRDFLYAKDGSRSRQAMLGPSLTTADLKRAALLVPDDAPYYKVSELRDDVTGAGRLVRDALFDRHDEPSAKGQTNWGGWSGESSDYSLEETNHSWSADGGSNYAYLDYKYDSTINDPHDARVIRAREKEGGGELRAQLESTSMNRLQQALQPARPAWAIAAESPQMSAAGPLFVEFRRAAVFSLRNPAGLNRAGLESAVLSMVQNRLLLAATAGATSITWTTNKNDFGDEWRRLDLPMLGWGISYAQLGDELIFSNNEEFLKAIIARVRATWDNEKPAPSANSSISELAVIRFDQREQVFTEIMEKIDAPEVGEVKEEKDLQEDGRDRDATAPSQAFFSGNIGSLLNVAARVKLIEIKRQTLPHRLHEEIAVHFN